VFSIPNPATKADPTVDAQSGGNRVGSYRGQQKQRLGLARGDTCYCQDSENAEDSNGNM
jgi:hypothetical protein